LNRTGNVRVLLAFLLCLLFAAKAVPSAMDEREIKCAETREKIRRIESKMRQGYTAKQGIKMQDELRSLRELRKRICR
jgi:F0F1-type ATP synthase membrane subunit b/b'